ncbi:hypothetical protein [Azospirillum endophyticum]
MAVHGLASFPCRAVPAKAPGAARNGPRAGSSRPEHREGRSAGVGKSHRGCTPPCSEPPGLLSRRVPVRCSPDRSPLSDQPPDRITMRTGRNPSGFTPDASQAACQRAGAGIQRLCASGGCEIW